jgi:hypothetical protein
MPASRGAIAALIILIFALTGCKQQPNSVPPSMLKQQLTIGGKLAEDSLYACLLNGLAQGLPITQASDDCATKLLDEPQGGGVGGIPGLIGDQDPFDPAGVQANCGAGTDPHQAQVYSQQPLGYRASELVPWTKVAGIEGFGYGTYGGKGLKDEDGKEYIGYSKEESQALKQEAIEKAVKLLEKYQELREQADKETDPAKKEELLKKAKTAEREWEKAHEEASKDPNKKEPGVPNTRTAPTSLCEQTLQAAREILYECNRTGWKTAQCQILAAKMNHCPDPRYIYVDPEAGYNCGEKIDPQAVKDAWSSRCEELVKYGPGGTNPCQTPIVNDDGRFVVGDSGDICRDPRAYVDPGSEACLVTLEVGTPFEQQGLKELIVWALDRLGGPIVVLPYNPDPLPVPPGPQPQPGPR